MKFITKCWHPNISSDSGAICLDILKTEWSPALTIRTALISLQALLSAAEPDDPQDAVVAKQYKEHHQEFMKTAKFWTETYACAQAGGACHGPTSARLHALGRARTRSDALGRARTRSDALGRTRTLLLRPCAPPHTGPYGHGEVHVSVVDLSRLHE